jgi:hypothetical protein
VGKKAKSYAPPPPSPAEVAAKKEAERKQREQEISDYRNQAQGYWSNYGKWMADEKASYEKDLAKIRAQNTAGGPNMYSVFEKERTNKYEQAMKDIQGGEHARFLKEYYEDTKSGGTKYGFAAGKDNANKMSMEDFYAKSFGAQSATGISSEEQAKQRARMAGGRQRTGAGGGAGGAGTVSTATTSFGLVPQEEKTTWW